MADAIAACFWLTVNALIVGAAWKTSRRLYPHDGLSAILLHMLVFWWAVVVSITTVLGCLGILTGPACLVAGACVAVSALYCSNRIGANSSIASDSSGRGRSWWVYFWSAVAAFAVGHVIVNGLLVFPGDWDTLMYHLPLVDKWLQARSLYVPDFSHWYNPGNSELLALWLAAPFTGDFLTPLGNLPPVVLLAVGMAELSRQAGLPRGWCNIAALAVLANFVVVRQLTDAENDVAVAALFLTCLAYGLRHARRGRLSDLVLGSTCLGLLAGVKYYALGYAALAAATLVLLALRTGGVRAGLQAGAVAGAGILVLGGYWYLRNLWISGTPVFPLGMTRDTNLMGEMYPNIWRSTLLGNGSPEVPALLVSALGAMAGLLYLVAVCALPITAGWLLACCFRRRLGTTERQIRAALVGALLGSGLVLGSTPFGAETMPETLNMLRGAYLPVRFGLCFLSLAVLALVVLLSDVSRWLRPRFGRESPRLGVFASEYGPRALFGGAALVQLAPPLGRLANPEELIESTLLGTNVLMAGVLAALIYHGWASRRRLFGVTLGVAALAGSAAGVDCLAGHWHEGFAGHYDQMWDAPIVSRLAELGEGGDRICVLAYRPYPFFGSGRQGAVCQPLRVPSLPWLLEYYRAWGVDFVVVVVQDQFVRGRYERLHEWHRDHPEWFELLESGPGESLFRVKRKAVARERRIEGGR
jgi:hypothetical protein